MEQNKLEKDFREKLSQREIQPSENSWDRLNAMLEITEEKKPKNKSGWLYIAAAIISFIAIGSIFLSQTEQLIDSPREDVVIENEIQIPSQSVDSARSSIQSPKQLIVNRNKQLAAEESHSKSKRQSINNHQSTAKAMPSENQIHQSQSTALVNNQSSINKTETQVAAIDIKVDALLAAVTPTENHPEISPVKVNAKNLLSQVDSEIKISFREKVIRTVSKNYQEVAEAVSNRNIQN